MKRFTLGNRDGKTLVIMLTGHLQHIWHTSHAATSKAVAARIVRELGDGPYTNPAGHFGRSQEVVVVGQDGWPW